MWRWSWPCSTYDRFGLWKLGGWPELRTPRLAIDIFDAKRLPSTFRRHNRHGLPLISSTPGHDGPIRAFLCCCCLPCARGDWEFTERNATTWSYSLWTGWGGSGTHSFQTESCLPPAPPGGGLSEGDKRNSTGDMPRQGRLPRTTSPEAGVRAAEATLLRSQHLGLGRGGPVPLFSHHFPREKCLRVGQRLERGDVCLLVWAGCVSQGQLHHGCVV
jgi:hypothetical protein